jgi:hypothetical protein
MSLLAGLARGLVATATATIRPPPAPPPAPAPPALPDLWDMTDQRVAAESRLHRKATR